MLWMYLKSYLKFANQLSFDKITMKINNFCHLPVWQVNKNYSIYLGPALLYQDMVWTQFI